MNQALGPAADFAATNAAPRQSGQLIDGAAKLPNTNMQQVDTLIEFIRDGRVADALEMLNSAPALATSHSEKDGQLHGASPLHWAAHRNAVEVCERLIELGADVNDSASDWWLTPLAWAADAGSVEAVALLLRRGGEINQDAIVGTTALHAVAMGGSTRGARDPDAYRRTAELLIARGADVNRRARGDRRQTPLDDAIANKNEAVANVLRDNGAEASA
jgi:hypothetical protein